MTVYQIKIQQWLKSRFTLMLLGLAGLAFLLGLTLPAAAQTISQGFDADDNLERGTIVVLNKEDTGKVEPATIDRVEDLYGVIINPNDAAVTLSEEGKKVFVATSSPFEVLVSTQNGPIEPGDFVTISSLAGIGMVVDDVAPLVVGRALTGFDGSNAASTAKVGNKTVKIGRVDVDILVGANPHQSPSEANLPEFLRQAAETIADKPVPAVRVYIAVFVFIVSTFIAASLMYSGVRSSIISIGRNPLSKKSIIKSMIQVVLVGLIIFIIGVSGVYLLLRM